MRPNVRRERRDRLVASICGSPWAWGHGVNFLPPTIGPGMARWRVAFLATGRWRPATVFFVEVVLPSSLPPGITVDAVEREMKAFKNAAGPESRYLSGLRPRKRWTCPRADLPGDGKLGRIAGRASAISKQPDRPRRRSNCPRRGDGTHRSARPWLSPSWHPPETHCQGRRFLEDHSIRADCGIGSTDCFPGEQDRTGRGRLRPWSHDSSRIPCCRRPSRCARRFSRRSRALTGKCARSVATGSRPLPRQRPKPSGNGAGFSDASLCPVEAGDRLDH